MDRLRTVAFQTIGRAVGFTGLGIFTVMTGLSYDPLMALRTGGVLVLILLAVLVFKARNAAAIDYRRTEMWLLVDKADRPEEPYAKWAASSALHQAYSCFARWTAGVAAILWGMAVVLTLLRFAPSVVG